MIRRLALVAVLAATPVFAQQDGTLRLACRADNPALLAAPLAFAIDLAAKQASETTSGAQYAVEAGRDTLVLQDRAGQPVFRLDRITGRFARVDKQLRLEGACEKVERKF